PSSPRLRVPHSPCARVVPSAVRSGSGTRRPPSRGPTFPRYGKEKVILMSLRACACVLPAAVIFGLVASGPAGTALGAPPRKAATRRRRLVSDRPTVAPKDASQPAAATPSDAAATSKAEPESVDVLVGLRTGQLAAEAKGTGD